MNGLLDEFARMASRAAEHADWLAQQGVPRSVLFGPHASVVGVARIETDGRYFQPTPGGRPAIIVPVTYSIAAGELEPIDVAAWFPDNPTCWFLRTGMGDVLGEEAMDEAWVREIPLPVYSTPLAWLQAAMEGVCFLDWENVAIHLLNNKQILTDTELLATRIRRELMVDRHLPTVKAMEKLDAA